ncbi:MAG: hypothetical protein RLW62_23930 [Gammaproteobacteria bacterium]
MIRMTTTLSALVLVLAGPVHAGDADGGASAATRDEATARRMIRDDVAGKLDRCEYDDLPTVLGHQAGATGDG